MSFSEVFRTSVRHGQYAWKEYTLLKIDEANYFMLVRNVHDSVSTYIESSSSERGDGGLPAKAVLGHSVRELFPQIGEEWFDSIKRAALDGETVESEYVDPIHGKRFHFAARQIIYAGYCAVTYVEI